MNGRPNASHAGVRHARATGPAHPDAGEDGELQRTDDRHLAEEGLHRGGDHGQQPALGQTLGDGQETRWASRTWGGRRFPIRLVAERDRLRRKVRPHLPSPNSGPGVMARAAIPARRVAATADSVSAGSALRDQHVDAKAAGRQAPQHAPHLVEVGESQEDQARSRAERGVRARSGGFRAIRS